MIASLLHRVVASVLFLLPRRDIRGIRIHFLPVPSSKRANYLSQVDKALGLIEKYDSSRFSRLSADVSAIVILPVAEFAGALNSSRICPLNGQHLLNDKGSIASVATLAHEAQHARLLRYGFSTREYNVNRIERVCKRAELHFLLRLPPFTNRENIIAMAEAAHSGLRR